MPKATFFNLPEDKRAMLVNALLDEFAEQPYKNASISRIVAKTGIAKGSFYQYFEDKKDCYLYLLSLGMEEKVAFLRQQPPADQKRDIFETMRWLLEFGIRFEFSNPRLAKISYRALFDDVPLPEETQATIRRGSMDYFRQLLQQGVEAGDVRDDVDIEVAAFMFASIFMNMGQFLMERHGMQPERLLEGGGKAFENTPARAAMIQVFAILEHGLRK